MKNMVATATVIRGKGECQVYMNGVVNEQIEKLMQQHAAEIEALKKKHAAEMRQKEFELEVVRNHRNRLLETEMQVVREMCSHKGIYAHICAMMRRFSNALIAGALKIGFIEIEEV